MENEVERLKGEGRYFHAGVVAAAQGQRARSVGDAPRRAGDGQRGELSRGSVLPARRHPGGVRAGGWHARRRQAKALADAGDRALGQIPRLLRGPVRRIVG